MAAATSGVAFGSDGGGSTMVGSGVVGVVWGVGVCGGQGVNWGIFSVLPRDVSVGSSVRRDVDERVGDGVVYGH